MPQKSKTSPDLPWKVRLYLSAISFGVDISRRSDGTVNRSLFNFLDFKASPLNKPINGLKSSDVTVDVSRNLWFRLYTPTATSNNHLPLIVYYHGGGFAFLTPSSKLYDDFCQKLAREIPATVVSVNYRLSPEHRYPCQYEDGFDVLNFIDNDENFNGLLKNVNLSQCFIFGDSAGANIAHHIAVKAGKQEFRRLNITGLIAMQPFFGGEERTESEVELAGAPLITLERADWMWRSFLPEGSDRDHPAVNVFGPNSGDISDVRFPATVIFVGGFDLLKDWQKRYCDGLRNCGKEAYLIEYPNAIHSFYAFPELPESSLMINEVKDFVQKRIE